MKFNILALSFTFGCVLTMRLWRAGSIEYSIWDDLMTEEGDLWRPTEEDTTLQRCV